MRPPVSHDTDADSGVSGAQSKTRDPAVCRITQRCAAVGSTSRDSAGGQTAYSAIAQSDQSAAHATRADACPGATKPAAPMPASSAAISCTTTPNRAYDRNIGTME